MISDEILFRIRLPFTRKVIRTCYPGEVYDFVEIAYIYIVIYKPLSIKVERQTFEDYWDK